MSCHGETNYHANDGLDWREFRRRTLERARSRGDNAFLEYVDGVSDRAWAHILEENFYTPEAAEERLWSFYNTDIVPYRDK